MAANKPSIKEVKIKLEGEYGKGFKDIVASVKELNAGIATLVQNTTKQASSMDKVEKEIKDTAKATEDAAKKTKGLAVAFEGLGTRIKTFAQYRVINMMTQSIINLGKAAVDLEANFANIQAITSASDIEMGKLRDTILRVGEASKYSVEEIAKATTMLGQAGLSADEINNVLETTTQLAAGTGSELSNTVDLMTSALAVWGLNSEEASHLSDVMVTGMNRTKATLETFRMAVQYAGATMASLNVSFDEFASVAAAASNAGLRASVVGTGLRAMTSELISPTKKMVRGLAELGLSTEDVNIESQGLVNVLYKLKNAGLTAANAYDLFGKRAAQFVLATQGQLDVVDELRIAFNESGATLKAYGTQMDTVAAQWTALGNTIKEVAYEITQETDGIIKNTLISIKNFIRSAFYDEIDEISKVRNEYNNIVKSAGLYKNQLKNIQGRDYKGDKWRQVSDVNAFIESANEQFGINIDLVKSADNLADDFERIEKALSNLQYENIQKVGYNIVATREAIMKQGRENLENALPMTSWGLTYESPQVGKPYESKVSEYESLLRESDKNYSKIKSEIDNLKDGSLEKIIAENAFKEAKRYVKEITGKDSNYIDLTKTENQEKLFRQLNSELSDNINTNIHDILKNANEDVTQWSSTLIESTYNSIEDKIAEIENKINDMSTDELDANKKSNLLSRISNLREKLVNNTIKELNDLEKIIDDSFEKENIETILDKLEKRSEMEVIARRQKSNKPKHTTPTYRGDPILDKAKKFNEKYSAQELALQNQKYGSDKERGRRAGVQSRLSDLGLDSSLLTSEYAKLSELEDKRTAKTQLNLLESYKKDYDDLSKKVENGQISLQEADRQSASLISKMRDLEVQTSQAKARFVDLDEQTLEDIQAQIDKTTEETEKLEKEAETAWGQFSGGFKKAVKDMADSYSMNSLGKLVAEDFGNGMADALYSISDGSKSVKEAFSDMARSILQDISRMLIRMAVMQSMMAAFGGGTAAKGVQVYDAPIGPMMPAANGGFIPKIRAALGTTVRGGVQGKDSVPAMLMPGEYVLKKSAVDALGTNFLNDLNNNAAQTLTSTAANMMQNPYESSSESEPSVVNVWVVSKEEEAKMGPRDVIATIGKDIMTGGQTRRLIQQVVVGRK